MPAINHSAHHAAARPSGAGHDNHNPMPVNGTPSRWQPAELQRATIDANKQRYANIDTAVAAGYRMHRKSQQDLADPTKTMFHLKLVTAKSDRSVLDPTTPEHVIYRRGPGGKFTLVGVMYETGRNDGSPLVGNLGRFHRHVGGKIIASEPGKGGMMHVWFSSRLDEAFSPHAPAEIKSGRRPTISPQAAALGTGGVGGHAMAPGHASHPLMPALLPMPAPSPAHGVAHAPASPASPATPAYTAPATVGAAMVGHETHAQPATMATLPQAGASHSLLGWLQQHIFAPLFGW